MLTKELLCKVLRGLGEFGKHCPAVGSRGYVVLLDPAAAGVAVEVIAGVGTGVHAGEDLVRGPHALHCLTHLLFKEKK